MAMPKSSKKKREVDNLDSSEHKREVKRLRTYSQDEAEGDSSKKHRHTRSKDKHAVEQEEEVKKEEAKPNLTVDEWRKSHNITIKSSSDPSKIPDPFREFSQAPFGGPIQKALLSAGFDAPTPVQAQAWSIAMQDYDMISIAKTGSGKTCGFLLPAFHNMIESRSGGRCVPRLLVLAPTRELSVQIMEEAHKFGRLAGIRSLCCYGGSSKHPQIAALHRGVDCIIATPGRLNDLIEMRRCDLSTLQYLVLDEADRMLDMGFEPQIRAILEHVPKERQTLLFSATWPREIQSLAREFLKSDAIQVNVGEVNALVANKDITQHIKMVSEYAKHDTLVEILDQLVASYNNEHSTPPINNGKQHVKTIVFCAKKVSCHELANTLWDAGYAVDSLHGDRPQWERTSVMQAFRSSQLRLLIATDVAARGLDVKDVKCVVNFDMPGAVEDYVHRIGRTGRAGASGIAYTMFDAVGRDKKVARGLVQVLEKAEQEVPAALRQLAGPPRGGGRGYGGRGRGGGRGYGGRGYGGGGRGYMGGGGGGGHRRGGYGGRGGGGGGRGYGRR